MQALLPEQSYLQVLHMEYTDSGIHAHKSTLQYTVEWIIGFAIFENGHIAANQEYFYEFNSKKLAKLTAPENRIILGEKFQIPCFHMKKNSTKRKKIINILF